MQRTKAKTSLPRLLRKAQDNFNAFIRERDKGQPCISCGKYTANQAGHYFSVKQFAALRFDEENVHLQCAYCNCYAHGNIQLYRMSLIKRIGEDKVNKLEEKALIHRNWKWSRFEVEEIIQKYARSTKRKQIKSIASESRAGI